MKKSVLETKYGLLIDEDSSYEEIRLQLLKHNFVYKAIVKKLNTLLDKAKTDEGLTYFLEHQEQFEKLQSILYQQLFFGGKASKNQSDVLFVREDGAKVKDAGIYVRFNPNYTHSDWSQIFEKIKYASKSLGFYSGNSKKAFQLPKRRMQKGSKDLESNLEIYLDVETRIPKFWRKKRYQIDKVDENKKNIVPVVAAAIVEIVEEKALSTKDEARIKEVYYRVSERYQLPGLKELQNYLKVLDELAD